MTLWAITQSPLILGANLTMLDDATLQLLTNRELLRIDQHAITRGHPVAGFETGDLRVWRAVVRGERGEPVTAIGIFNLSDSPLNVSRSLAALGLPGNTGARTSGLYDVWAHTPPRDTDQPNLVVPPHGCVLLERQ
jgi:hypothetical protein